MQFTGEPSSQWTFQFFSTVFRWQRGCTFLLPHRLQPFMGGKKTGWQATWLLDLKQLPATWLVFVRFHPDSIKISKNKNEILNTCPTCERFAWRFELYVCLNENLSSTGTSINGLFFYEVTLWKGLRSTLILNRKLFCRKNTGALWIKILVRSIKGFSKAR